ncbi:MAG: GAF domain-containing protein, partial [Candidatus Tectomicrobia bacterium]|nr:GAF domain-containing protein [Candidatus Tectomicrobia bacterium]
LLEEDSEILRVHATHGRIPPPVGRPLVFKVGEGIIGKVVETSQPIIIPDVQARPEWATPGWARRHDIHSYIASPLRDGERTIGVITCMAQRLDFFGPEELDLLGTFASQAALAIRNAKLFEESENQATRMSTLVEVTQGLSRGLDLPHILKSISEAAALLFRGEAGFRLLEGDFLVRAWTTPGASHVMPNKRIRVGESASGIAAQTGQPVVIHDVASDPRVLPSHREAASANAGRTGALMAIPIRAGERVLGTLNIYRESGYRFDPSAVGLATSLANHAALAIENARLHQAAVSQLTELAALQDTAKALTAERELPGLLNKIAECGARLLGADRCLILTLDREGPQAELLYHQGLSENYLETLRKNSEQLMAHRLTEGSGAIAVSDVRKDPRYLLPAEVAESEGFRSLLLLPLLHENQAFGALNFYWNATRNFEPAEVSLLQAFANQAATAIQKARLFEETRRRARRLEIASEIAKAVASTMEPAALFQTITKEIRRVIPCERCTISSALPVDRRLRYWHIDTDIEAAGWSANPDEVADWVRREVYAAKRIKTIPDLAAGKIPEMAHLTEKGFRSLIVVPISRDGRCVAHFTLSSTRPRAFTAEDEELLASVAGHVGAAIRNSTLFGMVQERASRLSTLHDLNRKVNQNLSLNEVLQSIVEAAVTLTGGEFSRVFLLDPAGQQLHLGAMFGHFPPPDGSAASYLLGKGLLGQAVQHGKPVRVGRVLDDPHFALKEWARQEGIHSYIAQPILHGEDTVGAINCLSRRENHFSEEDLELLGALASQAAIAIQNARLHEATRNRVSELESLQQATNALTTQIELPELLNRIVEEGTRLLGTNRCLIMTKSPESGEVQVLHAQEVSDEYIRLVRENFEQSVLARTLTAPTATLAVTDAMVDPRYPFGPAVAAREGIRAMLAAPLVCREKAFGVLVFYWNATRAFSRSEVALAQTFADQAAIAIENTRLFAETQERASRLEITARMAKAVASTLEPSEIFRIIVREIRRAVPCERCVISSYDEKTGRMNFWHFESDVEVSPPATGAWLGRQVYETNRPLRIPDLLAPPWEESSRHLTQGGLRSILFAPILQGGRCIANLAVSSTRPNAFSGAHERLLTAVAEHLGAAIRNATLYRTAEERASRLATLNLLNKGITENLQVSEVFDSITSAVVELLRADHCLIFMLDKPSSTLVLRASRGIFPVLDPGSLRFRPGEGVTGCVAQEGRPLLLSNLLKDPRWVDKGWGAGQGARSYICQPIIYGKEVIGVLGAFSGKEDYFTEEDLGFVGALASQAAIAIQNATLHEEERRSREFFRSVVKDNADAIVLTNQEGRIILWNPAAERYFGRAESEVLGRALARIIVPPEGIGEWKKTVGENTRKLLAEGRAFTFEAERMRKDGSLLPVSITVSPVINGRGEVIAVSSMYKDLTEQKRAEREREEYVERLKTLNMLSQKIGTTLDLEEVLDFIVDSAAWLLDVPFASIYLIQGGKLELHAFRGWLHPRLRGHVFEVGDGGVGQVAEKGDLVYIENVVEDPRWPFREESMRHGLSSFLGVPLKSDNKVVGVLCCMTLDRRRFRKDQYELIMAFANQAAIAVKNAEVYSQLEESFQELRRTQQLMIRTEKLSSLGVLAAGAAHEILNPANIIGIRAQRLAKWSAEGSREQQAADMILRNVRRITRICDDLRRFSRDEPPALQQFNPNETLRESLRLLDHKLRQGSIHEDLDLADGGETLWGDRHQIQQLFMNLFANALDVLPAGGRLGVSSRRIQLDGSDWWEARVADTGPGIPGDILTRIFDPFFTTKTEDKGTGLGLSVSLGIVENHGGKIWAENGPGGGAAFVVQLPLAKRRRKNAPDGHRG